MFKRQRTDQLKGRPMVEQPTQFWQRMPKVNPIWLVSVFTVVALVVGLYGGKYIERSQSVTPQTKVQHAVQALQGGYDQNALAILKPLADEGNPKAQYWLADIYENGLGVKPDMTMAVALLEKSAAQGFLPAEGHLGGLYLRGNETLQDFGKAQTWLHKAAVAGNGEAQRELGQIYALGLGVAADRPEAYAWYENATLSGDGLAKHMRDDVLARMSPEEIDKGEQDAKDVAAEIKPVKS
jgi:TPR repeat protein